MFMVVLGFISMANKSFAETAITTSLDIGSKGEDVTSLQTFLAKDSNIYPEGLITGYYGSLTAAAVTRFQSKYGIDAVGRVGPITRTKINELISAGGMYSGGISTGVAPYIYNISSSTMTNSDGTKAITLYWSTDKPTKGKVFYSSSPLSFNETSNPTEEPLISGNVVLDGVFQTTKSLSISNLPASTTSYNYIIEAVDANGNVSITWPSTFKVQ